MPAAKTYVFVGAVLIAASLVMVGQARRPAQAAEPRRADDEISRATAEVIRTATEYREKLVLRLELEQRDVERLARLAESRAPLLEKGYISRKEMEESQLAVARAEAQVKETLRQIEQAEMIVSEAEARSQLASLPPLPTGGYGESGALIRYNGGAAWSLADAGKVETFFSTRFGHPLPVSARGETEMHRQMKFDHRNAMDVAVHPDSAEGRGLMDYLRKAGIPFLAFRGKVAGSSTGAHIHIGRPSVRLAGP